MAPKQSKDIMTNVFSPSDNVKVSPMVSFLPSAITINRNNVIGTLTQIAPQTKLDTMINFLSHCPVSQAITLTPTYLYHDYLCEFWYTAVVQDDDSVNFTLKNNTVDCQLNLSVFRSAIGLDYLKEGESFISVPAANYRDIFAYCHHPSVRNPDGTAKRSGTVHMAGLSPTWRYFFSHIIECLGSKSGGLDQVNEMEMKIGYCLYKGLKVDYAKILYDNLLQKLKVRSPYVPYIRFLTLCFKHILQNQFDHETQDKSDPEMMKDFSGIIIYANEVPISDEMMQAIPLALRPKTGATTPVEPESTTGELQSDEVPIGGASGSSGTEPVLDIQPLNVAYPSRITTRSSKKDSVAPKGKTPKRFHKLSELPTDPKTQPKPTASSKKDSVKSKGTSSKSLTQSSVGSEGIHGSSQSILESVSAQTEIAKSSDTPLARTDDVVIPTTEVPSSMAGDVSVEGTTDTEARTTHIGDEVHMQTEPTEDLTEPSDLGTRPASWDRVDAISLLSSDSEDETDDQPIGIILSSAAKRKSPQFSQEMPPPPPPMNEPQMTDVHIQTETFLGPVIQPAKPISPPEHQESPPHSLENKLDATKTEVQNLVKKVENLQASISAHSSQISELQASTSRYFNPISSDIGAFKKNEKVVFEKLNELVSSYNTLNNSLRDSLNIVKRDVQSSIVNNITSLKDEMVRDLHTLKSEVLENLKKPLLNIEELTSNVSDSIALKMRGELIKEISETVSNACGSYLTNVVVPQMTAAISKQVSDAMDKKVMPEITKVLDSKLSNFGLSTEDRSMLAKVAKFVENKSWSAPSSTAEPSKGGRISQSEGEFEQVHPTGAGTDAGHVSSSAPITTSTDEQGFPAPPKVTDEQSETLKKALDETKDRKLAAKQKLIEEKVQLESMGKLDEVSAARLKLEVSQYRLIKDDQRIQQALAIMEEVELNKTYTEADQLLDSQSTGMTTEELLSLHEEGMKRDVAEAERLVKFVLTQRTAKLKKSTKPQSVKESKRKAEMNIDSFLAFTQLPGQAEIPHQVRVETTKRLPYAQAEEEKLKNEYEHMMTRRMHESKITEMEVTVKEGTSVETSTFWVTLTRANGMTESIQQCYVSYFGYDEWSEMIDVLLSKPNRNKYERAWLRAIDTAIQKKNEMEVVLGMKPLLTSPSPARPLKRKATEGSSEGSSPKRQA